MSSMLHRVRQTLDRFLFETGDCSIVPVIRIGYATLLIINILVWMHDAGVLFSDTGLLRASTAKDLTYYPHWSLFFWLPSTTGVVKLCLCLMLVQACLLWLGCWSRVQSACLFVWLVSFQHRNPVVCDGEDTLFRLMAFYLCFMPLDRDLSWTGRWKTIFNSDRASGRSPKSEEAWGLRLLQLQMAIIYASAAWSKLQGESWRDGTAMILVVQMTDLFGRVPLPDFLLDSRWMLRALTWTVLVVEAFLPIGLWFRSTRRFALLLGIGLHLGIELTMHLFLFEWLMILGLLSFFVPSEWGWKKPANSPTVFEGGRGRIVLPSRSSTVSGK